MKGKKLPDTTLSRAIVIEMKRKQPDESVRDFNHLDNEQFATLRRKLVRWATDNGEALKTTPTLPEDFHNRTRANWKPLFAIAELAGEDIVQKVTEAAQEIESRKDQKALSVQLLEDIRKIFINSDEEGPWSTYGRNDKPITMRQLANLLRAFGIASETVYAEPGSTKHGKGYKRAQFKEAWDLSRPRRSTR
jgi:putative DNA primase/helicase